MRTLITIKKILIDSLIPMLAKVLMIKSAFHGFDMERTGQDFHRQRKAGADEVLACDNPGPSGSPIFGLDDHAAIVAIAVRRVELP